MSAAVIAIVGAGAVGSAAALALAKSGCRVHLFDRYAFGHDRGSSHGPTRLFRLAYFEHADYVPLLRRSLRLWRTLETASEKTLYIQSGVLEAGPPEGFLIAGLRKAASEHDLALEDLTAAALNDRFPWLRLRPGDEAVFEDVAGFLLAAKAVAAQLELARLEGARLHPNEEVAGWSKTQSGLRISTAGGAYDVDRIIVAAGAWAPELLGPEIAPVAPLQKALFWIGAGNGRFHHAGNFKPFAIEDSRGRMFYGFPAVDDDGIKAGEHTGGTPLPSPSAKTDEHIPMDRELLIDFLESYAPGLPHAINKETTCLYEMSPDGHFIIGSHPDDDRVSFATGLSGHGFKFAPVIGEALASLALDKPMCVEMDFLNATRFKAV